MSTVTIRATTRLTSLSEGQEVTVELTPRIQRMLDRGYVVEVHQVEQAAPSDPPLIGGQHVVPQGDRLEKPPAAGPGSGRAAQVAYLAQEGVEHDEDATVGELRDLVAAHESDS